MVLYIHIWKPEEFTLFAELNFYMLHVAPVAANIDTCIHGVLIGIILLLN